MRAAARGLAETARRFHSTGGGARRPPSDAPRAFLLDAQAALWLQRPEPTGGAERAGGAGAHELLQARPLRNAAEAAHLPDNNTGPLACNPVAQLFELPAETPLLLQLSTHQPERRAGAGGGTATFRRPPGQRGPRGLQCLRVMDVDILHCAE
jgi:hypothetical protein